MNRGDVAMDWRRGLAEAALFIAASTAGIYGLGEGLNGFFGGAADPWWLAVSAVALAVLAKQMGRVQDRWPRRAAPAGDASGTAISATTSGGRDHQH